MIYDDFNFLIKDAIKAKLEYAKSLCEISNPYLSPREKRLRNKKLYEEQESRCLLSRTWWTDRLRRSSGVERDYCLHYIRENEEELRKIKRRIDFLSMPRADCKNMDISVAKAIPIDSLFEVLPNGFFVNNPLREERSPSNSFHLNRKKNIWCDYGTGEHGDILDLVMKINKCDLKTAYNILIKY